MPDETAALAAAQPLGVGLTVAGLGAPMAVHPAFGAGMGTATIIERV